MDFTFTELLEFIELWINENENKVSEKERQFKKSDLYYNLAAEMLDRSINAYYSHYGCPFCGS